MDRALGWGGEGGSPGREHKAPQPPQGWVQGRGAGRRRSCSNSVGAQLSLGHLGSGLRLGQALEALSIRQAVSSLCLRNRPGSWQMRCLSTLLSGSLAGRAPPATHRASGSKMTSSPSLAVPPTATCVPTWSHPSRLKHRAVLPKLIPKLSAFPYSTAPKLVPGFPTWLWTCLPSCLILPWACVQIHLSILHAEVRMHQILGI